MTRDPPEGERAEHLACVRMLGHRDPRNPGWPADGRRRPQSTATATAVDADAADLNAKTARIRQRQMLVNGNGTAVSEGSLASFASLRMTQRRTRGRPNVRTVNGGRRSQKAFAVAVAVSVQFCRSRSAFIRVQRCCSCSCRCSFCGHSVEGTTLRLAGMAVRCGHLRLTGS